MKKMNSKEAKLTGELQQEVANFPEQKKEMMRYIYHKLQARQKFLQNIIETFHIKHKLLQETMHWNGKAITDMLREDICHEKLIDRLEIAIIYILKVADLKDYEPASSQSDKHRRKNKYEEMKREWEKKNKLDPWEANLEQIEYELCCDKTFYHSMTGRSLLRQLNALWQLDQKAGLIHNINNK